MALSKNDREEITNLIQTVVNGNIRRVGDKVEELHEKMEPVIEAIQWVETTRKIVVRVSAFVVAVSGIAASYNIFR
jgi:hypothetical protein